MLILSIELWVLSASLFGRGRAYCSSMVCLSRPVAPPARRNNPDPTDLRDPTNILEHKTLDNRANVGNTPRASAWTSKVGYHEGNNRKRTSDPYFTDSTTCDRFLYYRRCGGHVYPPGAKPTLPSRTLSRSGSSPPPNQVFPGYWWSTMST